MLNSNKTIELNEFIRYIEKIPIESSENIYLTKDKVKEIVEKLKKYIDISIKIDVSAFQKELKGNTLFLKYQDINLCEKYIKNLLIIKNIQNDLWFRHIECIERVQNLTPNQKYIDDLFIPCIMYLEEKYKKQNNELENLYNLYDEKSKQLLIKISETKTEKIHNFSSIQNFTKIENKYNKLRKKLSKNINKKYFKIKGKKINYLHSLKDNEYILLDRRSLIIETFAEMHLYRSSVVNLIKIKELLDTLQYIVEIINKKYNKIIKNKNLDKKIIYFSNIECLECAEIYELLDEFRSIIVLIQEEFENIVKDKEYLKKEFNFSDDNKDDIDNKLFYDERSIICELYSYSLNEYESDLDPLFLIFSEEDLKKLY